MKKILFAVTSLFLLISLLLVNNVNALGDDNIINSGLWKISGTDVTVLDASWTVTIPTLSVGAITMTGDLDMGANDILQVDSIFGSTSILPVRIGDAGTTSHSMSSEDDLLVTGQLEVNGTTFFDGQVNLFSTTILGNAVALALGTASAGGTYLQHVTASTQVCLSMGSLGGRNFVITEQGNFSKNHDHALQTNPTLWIHSSLNPDTDNTQYGKLVHNQTNFVVGSGKGSVQVTPASTFGVDIETSGSKATCDATTRGQLFVEEGAGGVTDTLYMCLKAAADSYSWISITTGG